MGTSLTSFQKRPRSTYIKYFFKNAFYVVRYALFRIKKSVVRFAGKRDITQAYSNQRLIEWIQSGKPFAAVRFGAVELGALNNYEKLQLGFARSFKPSVRYSMKNNAGFFPADDINLTHYAKHVLKELHRTDILGISGIHMEDYFYQKYIPNAEVIQYNAFEPLVGDWVQALRGKKVLVISPFAQEIEAQHRIRSKLFGEGPYRVDFSLQTVKAVQTIGEQLDPRYSHWFEALDAMKVEILKHDFDIALVGAGAYGTPLCWFIQSLNKQAIQTGGATPTLFGIIGRRWEKRPHVAKHMNPYWIRPLEKPRGFERVENGAYW